MIWKFLKQHVLYPKGLNWVQHLVSRIGLSTHGCALFAKASFQSFPLPRGNVMKHTRRSNPCNISREITKWQVFAEQIVRFNLAFEDLCCGAYIPVSLPLNGRNLSRNFFGIIF